MLKNIALLLVSVLVTLLCLEGVVRIFGLYSRERAEIASPEAFASLATPEKNLDAKDQAHVPWVLHPYLGWTRRTQAKLFQSYISRPEGDFKIGLFGGSVAFNVAYSEEAQAALIDVLQNEVPGLGEVVVLPFGVPGFKQPQQLFLLSQAALMGIELDVVVNLDGFNEVAHGDEDARRGFHPLFPRHTITKQVFDFSNDTLTREEILLTAEVLELERRRQRAHALVAEGTVWHHWESAKLVLGILASHWRRQAAEINVRLAEAATQATGESYVRLDDPRLGKPLKSLPLIHDLWRDASIQMHLIAQEMGATYIHVLQPNQYIEDAKPLSPEERAHAYDPARESGQTAAAGYPILQRGGQQLRQQGVDFHDLSLMFAEHPETLYIDTCCHFNERGKRLIAEALGGLIAGAVAESREQ